ncbi:MAG: metal ABC transporter ATP-binding protein [bacterium]
MESSESCHLSPQGNFGACCTKVEHLSVFFDGRCALADINLHFHCGELMAVIGPNGGGKTTLLRAILGELPHAGAVHFVDEDKKRPDAPIIGYVPQKLAFDPDAPINVADLFAASLSRWPVFLGGGKTALKKTKEMLAVVEAEHLLRRPVGQLSGGELQRALLALALTPAPNLLLLDEPVAHVDAKGMELFYRVVSRLREQYDLAVILVSHDLAAAARVADTMVFLDQKIFCAGRPSDVLKNKRVREAFGFNFAKEESCS